VNIEVPLLIKINEDDKFVTEQFHNNTLESVSMKQSNRGDANSPVFVFVVKICSLSLARELSVCGRAARC